MTQPALSAGIRKLERELGVPLVYRHQRYDDLTPEGQALLGWAKQAVAGVDGLTAEASRLRKELTGTLRLGVIPTALLAVSLITRTLLDTHPGVKLDIRSLSSIEIARQLDNNTIDAGITYLDNEPVGPLHTTAIYHERYIFVTASDIPPGTTIRWAQLADIPLCLLTPDMQNRRIVNAALQEAGIQASPRVEANSISALLSFARAGRPCVMAHTWLALHSLPAGMRSLALTDPEVTHSIGLVTPNAQPDHPIVRALKAALTSVDIDQKLQQESSPIL